jgi:hypothetical protein
MTDAIIATAAMVVSCIVGVIGEQASVANRGWLASAAAWVGFYASIIYTVISVNVIDGHDLTREIVVLGVIGVGVFFGTKVGQVLGARILTWRLQRKGVVRPLTDTERLTALEAAVKGLPLGEDR